MPIEAIEQKEIENSVKMLFAKYIEDKVTLLVEAKLDRIMREHLNDIITTAKDEAVKQIAAKLLKCALE